MTTYFEKLKQLGSLEKDLSQVTIGVTVFDRPGHLVRFLESVRKFFPTIPINIADNGFDPVPSSILDSFQGISYHRMEVDCGLSVCRNHLLDTCSSPYLMICEEDFEFTEETQLGKMISVLEDDPEIALVGAPLVNENGERAEFSKCFDYFRGRLTTIDNQNPFRVTKDLVSYRYADMVFNFFLCRKEAFPDIRWDASLKLAEHLDHMFRIYKQRRWRIAHIPTVSAIHNRSGRSDRYIESRLRARDWVRKWQGKHTYRDNSEFSPWYGKPDIIVYGVGHSGTSYLSHCFQLMGWKPLDSDEKYHESRTIRKINNDFFRTGVFNQDAAYATLKDKNGWSIKDPRFVETLPLWLPVFTRLKKHPVLVWIEKDIEDVRKSYEKRGEYVNGVAGVRDLTLEQLYELAESNYNSYPYQKVRIRYEDLAKTAGAFVFPLSVLEKESCMPESKQDMPEETLPQAEEVKRDTVLVDPKLVLTMPRGLRNQLLNALIANNKLNPPTTEEEANRMMSEATLAFWRGQLAQYLQNQVNNNVIQAFSGVTGSFE